MRRCDARLRVLACALAAAAASGLAALPGAAQETGSVPPFLRLSDAIDIALRSSTLVGIQSAQLDATRKARLNALFNLGPDLSLSADKGRSTRTDFDILQVVPATGDTIIDNFDTEFGFRQYGVAARVRLFDGFSNLWRLGAANQDVRSDEYTLEYRRKQVQTNVIAAYYNLLRAQLLLRVAQEAETVAREQLERTQALYDLGSAARSDVLKSQVQLGQTRLTLVQARNGERQARTDLEYAMNLSTPVPFEIDSTIAQIPQERVDFAAESDYAVQHREDLLALRADELAARRRTWAARGGLLPTVDFQYAVNQTKTESPFRFGAEENRTRQWAFSANWNVWDRYLTYSSIGQARATARISEYNRRQAELDAIREVRTLVNDLEEARERLAVSRENVARSQEDLRLAQEKFRVGAGTILDIVTAESDLTSTRANEVQAVVDYLIARANLARATGRPFSEL